MYIGFHIKYQLLASVYNETGIFSTGFRKTLKYEGWNFNSGNYLFTTDTK